MEAIRGKSSSQVSSQVMFPFGCFWTLFLALGVSTTIAVGKYKFNYPVEMEKYEYCVKLVVACNKLRDRVEMFTSQEFATDIDMAQEMVDDNLNEYHKTGCVPDGLSPSGLQAFWNLVAQWEKQLNDMFLHPNLFAVVEENNRGRQMKVTFGKVQAWCPNENDVVEDITTVIAEVSEEESEEEETSTLNPGLVKTSTMKIDQNDTVDITNNTADSCEISSPVVEWVRNEVNGTIIISSLTGRFSEFEKLLRETGHGCCPYKSARDQMEIINDGIDILEDLQDLKPSEKKNYSDVDSDYRNLNQRLQHLKTGNANYSSGKCCPAFLRNFNSFQNDFQSSLKDFNPRQTNTSLKDLLKSATTLEVTCSEQLNQLKEALQNLNSSINNTNNTCCDEEEKSFKLIENSLKEFQANKSHLDLSETINSIREDLAKTNKTFSDTENLLGLEAKQIDKLKTECGKVIEIQRKSNILHSHTSNVIKPVNKPKGFIRTANLAKQKLSLRTVETKRKMDSIQNVANTIRASLDTAEKCIQNIESLNNTFKRVELESNEAQANHELHRAAVKKDVETYRKGHEDLKESARKLMDSSNSDALTPDINKLEKDLINLKDVDLPKMALDITNRRMETAPKAAENEQQKQIALFNEEIKKKKAQILERLDKLSQTNPENSTDEDSEKIRQLEALVSKLSDQLASLAKKIADRQEVLRQRTSDLKKRIAEASAKAHSCTLDCDLGDLPTVDSLAKRFADLEKKAQTNTVLKQKGKPVPKKMG